MPPQRSSRTSPPPAQLHIHHVCPLPPHIAKLCADLGVVTHPIEPFDPRFPHTNKIRQCASGADRSLVRLDPTGIQDGAGSPTVQDGDILQYRASDQTLHPAPKAALNPTSVAPLVVIVSDPPTQVEVQAAYDKINELIAALIRP